MTHNHDTPDPRPRDLVLLGILIGLFLGAIITTLLLEALA